MVLEFKELDVRPMLAAGVEPFVAIMAAVDSLGPEEGLSLVAPFEPQPLFSVMDRKGFRHEVAELGSGDFEVRFVPKKLDILSSGQVANADEWPEPLVELDLTDLDPPQPMVKILHAIETIPVGMVIFAVLAREPLFLFPELVKRGHQWVGNYDREGASFRIMIRRGEAQSS